MYCSNFSKPIGTQIQNRCGYKYIRKDMYVCAGERVLGRERKHTRNTFIEVFVTVLARDPNRKV